MKSESFRTTAYWTAFLVLTAGSLRYVPGLRITAEAWIVICGFLAVGAVRARQAEREPFERYLLLMMAYLPVASSVAALRIFGQPLAYGLLQHRGILVVGATLHVLRRVREGTLDLVILERAFKAAAVFMLLFGVAIRLLVDTSGMADTAGFYDSFSGEIATDATFIVFGFLYFALHAISRGAPNSFFWALLFGAYLVLVDGGRFQLVSIVAALVVSVLQFVTVRQRVLFAFLTVVVGPALFVGFAWIAPAKAQALAYSFQDAWLLLATGEEGLDISANSRLLQFDVAWPFVTSSPMFGNGFLSQQWQEGFQGALGYFHPSDTGLYGVVFVYGVVGLLMFLWQLKYAASAAAHLGIARSSMFIRAVLAFLWFWSIYSLTSAKLAFMFEWSVLLVGVVVAQRISDRQTTAWIDES